MSRRNRRVPVEGRVFTLERGGSVVHILGEDHRKGPQERLPRVDVLLVEYDVFHASESLPPFGQLPTTSRVLKSIDHAYKRSSIQPSRLPSSAVPCDVREACHVLKDPGLYEVLRDSSPRRLRQYLQYRTSRLLDPPRAVQQLFCDLLRRLAPRERDTYLFLFDQYRRETSSLLNFERRRYAQYGTMAHDTDIIDALYHDAPQKMTDFYFVLNILARRTTPAMGVLCGFHHVRSLRTLLSSFGFAPASKGK